MSGRMTRELEAVRQSAAAGEDTTEVVKRAIDAGHELADVLAALNRGLEEDVMRKRDEALDAVARCREAERRAQRDVREAIIAAHWEGLTTRQIAAVAGLSFQRIAQIVAEGPDVPVRGPKKKGSK